MGCFLSDREIAGLAPAERAAFRSPIPTRMVSNGAFNPLPQSPAQREVEARIGEIADANGRRPGLDRRGFLRSARGMAAAFLAMNEVFGPLFDVGRAEAQQPEAAAARSGALRGRFVFDDQLHFVRDDYGFEGITGLARCAAEHWNPSRRDDRVGMGLERYEFENFLKEIFLDSDTRGGLLSGAPFDDPKNWFLTNDQIKQAALTVNGIAGTRRLLFHSLFTPKQPGWMDEADRVIAEVRPTSAKGCTIGDPLSPQTTRYPWRLDDEALMHPFHEKLRSPGGTLRRPRPPRAGVRGRATPPRPRRAPLVARRAPP